MASSTETILWQVQEDDRGRWRDFPNHLMEMVELEYLKWIQDGKPGQLVVAYSWPNAKGTARQEYQIVCEEDGTETKMYQVNANMQTMRSVRRLVVKTD